MELTHRFTVPAGVEETWAHFNDIASVATCFPGAQVTESDEESFKGTVKVKLGPIALVYTGSGTFVEKDESAHRMLIDAKGKDKRGNGTAGAKVTATMTETSPGQTEVEVVTDLAITGKPAQFGRGVIQDVSDKLLGQFTSCLEDRLGESGAPAAEAESAAPAAGAAAAAAGTSPEPAPAAAPAAPAPAASTAPAGGAHAAPRPAQAPSKEPEALDLGATVLPVLLKAYGKWIGVGVLVIAVLIWWLTRD